MPNILLWGSILIFAINSFGYTYNLSGVNRAFYGCFKAVAETSIIAYSSTGLVMKPYFHRATFKAQCEKYFASALRPYTSSYELSYYFADASGNTSSKYPVIAEVGLSCKVYGMKNFHKSASFFVEEGKHGGI